MAFAYEKEQKGLKLLISDCEKELCNAEKKTVDMKTLYQGLMEFTQIKELNTYDCKQANQTYRGSQF